MLGEEQVVLRVEVGIDLRTTCSAGVTLSAYRRKTGDSFESSEIGLSKT